MCVRMEYLVVMMNPVISESELYTQHFVTLGRLLNCLPLKILN